MAVVSGPRPRVQPRPRPYAEPRESLLERAGVLKLDFALLLGAVGLIAFSIYTLGEATAEDVPGDPYFYVIRQSIYATVGIALMLAVARVDYSRFRELRVGIYSAWSSRSASSSYSPRQPAAPTAGSSFRSSPSSPLSSARCF